MGHLKKLHALTTATFLPLLAITTGISSSSATAQSTMSITEWQSRAAIIDARMKELNARVQELLARCTGMVEEGSPLQAQCDQGTRELAAAKDELFRDRDNLIEQKKLTDAQ